MRAGKIIWVKYNLYKYGEFFTKNSQKYKEKLLTMLIFGYNIYEV